MKNTPKKLTKRQRKALKGPNDMVLRSLNQGKSHTVAGTNYRGAPRVIDFETGKVLSPGIPFVRA